MSNRNVICVSESELREAIIEAIKNSKGQDCEGQYDLFGGGIIEVPKKPNRKRDMRTDFQKQAERDERARQRKIKKEKEIEDRFNATGRTQLQMQFEAKLRQIVFEKIMRKLRTL
jgi:hypothetical protein